MGFSELCIRRPVFATVLSLVIVLLGVVSYTRLTVREYPNVDEPVVSVSHAIPAPRQRSSKPRSRRSWKAPSRASPASTCSESSSRSEDSRITVRFRPEIDQDVAASDVRDRVSRVRGRLPDEIDEPVIAKVEADAQPVMMLVFTSPVLSPLEITDYVDRFVVDQLKNLNGVADVTIYGERRYAMRIWIDRERLAAFSLTVQDIETALRAQNVELPSGRIESTNREFSVLSKTGLVTPEEFRNIVIKLSGDHQVKLGEVARVELGAFDERRESRYGGKAAIADRRHQAGRRQPARRVARRARDAARDQPVDAERHAGRRRQRRFHLHRALDRGRLPHHRRGDRAGGARDHLLPALRSAPR